MAATAAWTDSAAVTSHATASASPPAAVISSTVAPVSSRSSGGDAGPLGGEPGTGDPPHPGGGAGDERDLSFEAKGHRGIAV